MSFYDASVDLSPAVVPDTAGLKALAHPVRLKMLGLLRVDGPATATSLAERLGLNSGATSYHLRQLAAHGFIVDDAERGNGRERWWMAAHRSTRTSSDTLVTPDGDSHEAQEGYLRAVAMTYVEQLQDAVEERAFLPAEWRSATTFSDWVLRLSPARARALLEAVESVIEDAPEGDDTEVPYVIQVQAFPRPGTAS